MSIRRLNYFFGNGKFAKIRSLARIKGCSYVFEVLNHNIAKNNVYWKIGVEVEEI